MNNNTSKKTLFTKTLFSIAISSALPFSISTQAADFFVVNGETRTTQISSAGAGDSATIEVGGLLTVNVIGINYTGADVAITNNGSIMTTGTTSYGIFSSGDDSTIANNGSIMTMGNDGFGIYHVGVNGTVSNSGSITTTDAAGLGINSGGADVTITNSGSITTAEFLSIAIFSTGANVSINNSGTITTTGDVGYGIYAAGASASISNSGTITITGDSAHGIYAVGANASISNSGTITITGDVGYGIYAAGANASISNSGSISATGAGALAIAGNPGANYDTTLSLLAGSQIIGAIDLGMNGTDNDTVNIYGGSQSANLTLLNVENINLFGPGVVSGNNVITVDPTQESSRSVALSRMSGSIHQMISQRMRYSTDIEPVKVAAITLAPSMFFSARQPTAWMQFFGGEFDRDAEGGSLAYNNRHKGLNFGYEWDTHSYRVGLVGGYVRSDTDSDISSFKTDADSYYLGGYGHLNFAQINLTTSLIAGYSEHDNKRLVVDNVSGFESARSDMDSKFISPSATLSAAYQVASKVQLRPSVSINYSVAQIGGYREKGTTSANLNVDDRTLKVLTARAQIAAALELQASELEFRMGASARNSNDADIDVSIGASRFSYDNTGDDNVAGFFGGVNLRVAAHNNLDVLVDVELGGDSNEDYVNGHVSLTYIF